MTTAVKFTTARDDTRAIFTVDVDDNIVTVAALKQYHDHAIPTEEGWFRYGFGSPSEAQHVANLLTRDLPKLIARMFNAKIVK